MFSALERTAAPHSKLADGVCPVVHTRRTCKGVMQAAGSAGRWEYNERQYERVQIRTIGDLLAKRWFDTPAPVQPLDWERRGRLPF